MSCVKKSMYLSTLFLVVAIILFISPSKVFAAVIVEQTDSATSVTASSTNNFFLQCIAVSSTDTVGQIDVYVDGKNQNPTGRLDLRFYSDGNCTTQVHATTSGTQTFTGTKYLLSHDFSADNLNLTGTSSILIRSDRNGGGFTNPFGSWGLTANMPVYYVVNDTGGGGGGPTETEITTVVPAGGSTNATSSSFTLGATGYVSEDDFRSGLVLWIKPYNPGQGFLLTDTFEIPIDVSGSFDVSTTTDLFDGDYYGNVRVEMKLMVPRFSVFGFSFGEDEIVSTTTIWTLNEGNFLSDLTDELFEITEDILFSSTTASVAGCAINFLVVWAWNDGLKDCVSALVVVAPDFVIDKVIGLKDEFIHKVPWGYAVTVYETWTASTTAQALPNLILDFDDMETELTAFNSIPAVGTLDLTPWTHVSDAVATITASTIDARDTGDSVWTQFLFYWNTLWYIMFAWWLLSVLMGYRTVLSDASAGVIRGGKREIGRHRNAKQNEKLQQDHLKRNTVKS
jgi:hypothetical protein